MESGNAHRFLKAVEDAETLIETLKKLQAEAASYRAAGRSLESVRDDLKEQLLTAYEISKGLGDLLNTLAAFGPQVVDGQKTLENKMELQLSGLDEKICSVAESTEGISVRIEKLEEKLKGLRSLLIYAIAAAAVAAAAGIINILL